MKHALSTMVGVPTFVSATQMDIFSVAAELDTDWMAMVKTAMVRTFLTISLISKFSNLVLHLSAT